MCNNAPAPKRVADLGSGDGRIVIALAEQGFPSCGYELNPWLVWYSRCGLCIRCWQAQTVAGGALTVLACRTLPHSAAQIYGRQTFLSMMLLLSSELPRWLVLVTSCSQCTDERPAGQIVQRAVPTSPHYCLQISNARRIFAWAAGHGAGHGVVL